jgi:hypothetical protein
MVSAKMIVIFPFRLNGSEAFGTAKISEGLALTL